MNFNELFDFNHRVQKSFVMVKKEGGKEITKNVYNNFNFLAGIFMIFYAIFSSKYKTKGFIGYIAIPFFFAFIVNCILGMASPSIYALAQLAEFIWFGMMFNTWFYNQLKRNGYKEDPTKQIVEE
ncbi:hypothetical protein DY120_00725 [Apilactobacillus micheneri]|uniref:Uncharacterized protein n=1 Tax=Apilactobacillus micheneri TaxID=1899430 RepID=A0ABY2Z2G2_9LACO|nr:hypothetical protein [Apilactobacillus micheneri]TPR26254.1 hypothetical protein DY114_00725 [Apilactobacillus micheneri]TPR27008.1 hypothetical protein DY111_00725 [Apilactobacillus micheneri]TPR27866.1 hypothetical protein DY113_04500 [Apilactobacillus micheneri]TPR31771.1 hypothetical protein DY117_00725 [Apilactobacillus micheneri]TPR32175.1 hypothetical protein DY120_00725 [Apilactobacillus micheneri]